MFTAIFVFEYLLRMLDFNRFVIFWHDIFLIKTDRKYEFLEDHYNKIK